MKYKKIKKLILFAGMFSIMSCMPIKADTLPCEIINMESLPDNQDATYDADANMEYIKSVCAKYDLDVNLVLAVIKVVQAVLVLCR